MLSSVVAGEGLLIQPFTAIQWLSFVIQGKVNLFSLAMPCEVPIKHAIVEGGSLIFSALNCSAEAQDRSPFHSLDGGLSRYERKS